MADSSKREELIERPWTQDHYVTRNSISEDDTYRVWMTCRCGWNSGDLPDGNLPTTHQAELEHYVAVFEQAHTPTDDERDGVAKAMCAIETRSKAATLEEVQAGIQRWMRHRYEAERLIEELADAGFEVRRTVQDDPSQVLAWIEKTLALPMYQDGMHHDYDEGVVTTLRTVRKMLNGTTRSDASWRTVQGEPTDAAVIEAVHAIGLRGFHVTASAMRAALRAAAEQGENR